MTNNNPTNVLDIMTEKTKRKYQLKQHQEHRLENTEYIFLNFTNLISLNHSPMIYAL